VQSFRGYFVDDEIWRLITAILADERCTDQDGSSEEPPG